MQKPNNKKVQLVVLGNVTKLTLGKGSFGQEAKGRPRFDFDKIK